MRRLIKNNHCQIILVAGIGIIIAFALLEFVMTDKPNFLNQKRSFEEPRSGIVGAILGFLDVVKDIFGQMWDIITFNFAYLNDFPLAKTIIQITTFILIAIGIIEIVWIG